MHVDETAYDTLWLSFCLVGTKWPLFRIADHSVAQVAYQLVGCRKLWLPGWPQSEARGLQLCALEALGDIGPYHLDISSPQPSGRAPRGPFEIRPLVAGREPTYPVLASHEADNERVMEIPPDAEGMPRIGKNKEESDILEERRNRIWDTRSRFHVNTDFRFNSQSLVFCLTTAASIGGRAWPTAKMKNGDHEVIATLWGNSTLGLLTYWWLANKAQDGRGSITTTQIPKLVVLDPRQLSQTKIQTAKKFFADIRAKPLKPAHLIAEDQCRAQIDEFVLRHLLDYRERFTQVSPSIALLRRKLALEPSFHGGRS